MPTDPGWLRRRVAGHFGEFLQGRLGPDGPVCLITLPCASVAAHAAWRPGGALKIHDHGSSMIGRATLRALFSTLRATPPHGRFLLRAGLRPGSGGGMSTAALLAVIECLSPRRLAPDRLARLCLRHEGASDPLMVAQPETVLWAPRTARILENLPTLPRFWCVGGTLGPPQWTDPQDTRFADVSDLVAEWRRAARDGNHAALAAISQQSAQRNVALRGGPALAPLITASRALGALGIAVAHTGNAVTLLFRPGSVPDAPEAALRALGLRGIFRFRTGGTAT